MATTYKILWYDPDRAGWYEHDEMQMDAPGARSAIRAYCEQQEVAGIYVAVPLRSWKPVNVQPSTGVKITKA